MFTVAAIVFPKTVYLNIKSTQTVAIQDNNKKRFAIYLKTENGWFSERKTQRPVIKGMFCLRAGRWHHTSTCTIPKTDSTEGKWTHFLPWLCYKRNGKRCSCAAIELWIHLGGLLSTQEARVALGYTSSNSTLLSCLATSHIHPLLDGCTLDVYHFLSVFCRQTENQCMEMKECSLWKGTRKFQSTYTHIRQKVHGNLYADNMERNTEISMYLLSQCASEHWRT